MVVFRPSTLAASAAMLALSAASAFAGDDRVSGSIGVGIANVYATETVYSNGQKLSHLDWQSRGVQVLRGAIDVEIGDGWTLRAEGKAGMNGDGKLTDYDWIAPFYSSTSKNSWSHRSIHDDTKLDHYYTGSVELSRRIFGDSTQKMSIGFGGRFTDVKWTARGGSFVYSVNGPRDTSGNFADGERGISYQQKIPVLYATLSGEQNLGRWKLTGALEAGASIKAKDVDDHWMRNLRFNDELGLSAVFGAKGGVEYKLARGIAWYVDGSFETTKFRKGDIKTRDTTTGETAVYKDAAGGSFGAVYIGTGIKGSF